MNVSIKDKHRWEFINELGDFIWEDPIPINELYMPLCNEKGMMSSITPCLKGDIKISNDYFLTQPVTIEDLHNIKSSRNFWFYITGKGLWSASGNSALQNSKVNDNLCPKRKIEAGMLWHKHILRDKDIGLQSSILNFIASENNLEIMVVEIKNISSEPMELTPTSSIPIYARSAENIRDHRHVTSLVNRATIHNNGIFVKPFIKFNEKGHSYNHISYYVLGCDEDGCSPVGTTPLTKDFIGEKGSYDWPEAVLKNLKPVGKNLNQLDGKEYVGALHFDNITLKPGESKSYILLLGICSSKKEALDSLEKFNSKQKVLRELEIVKSTWSKKANNISFNCGPGDFSTWIKWVSIQPTLRKIFGNSFLPYHDYGKGGRGWRDLWQDVLTLTLQNPSEVRHVLIDNLSGIRIDGTNATIIQNNDGNFISDRNKIPRVWMDHGTWPYLSIKLYIDQTGDFNILLEETSYFQDAFLRRTRVTNNNWNSSEGYKLKIKNGEIYFGTALEHLLIQHLVSFFNVGEHNMILLENADWNDGIDMGMDRGESIAFTALYAGNMMDLAQLLKEIKNTQRWEYIEIFEELQILFDTKNDIYNYSSVEYKKNLLEEYFYRIDNSISGKKLKVPIDLVINDLIKKAESIFTLIRENEWISIDESSGFFNSYYDNLGQQVDMNYDIPRMQLIGQVFSIMSNIATGSQVKAAYNASFKYLKDPIHGGYRLNTDIGDDVLNLGRFLAFAYGEKENGATFSHMVVMFMNALYKRGFVKEGYEVFTSLLNLCLDVKNSKIYPGIPEYFNPERKGLYPYLTGSASWLILTILHEVFGVKCKFGDLLIEPRLMPDQFDKDGNASLTSYFHDKRIKIIYENKGLLDYGEYEIKTFSFNSQKLNSATIDCGSILIPKNMFIENSFDDKINTIIVKLGHLNDKKKT